MGFIEFLTLILVVLKATGHLTWTWFQVFLPEIICFVIYILFFLGFIFGILKLKSFK